MYSFIVRRILWAIVVFVFVTICTFIIFYVIPFDPAALAAGPNATPADLVRVRHFLGLDHSVPYQYGMFLKRLIVDQSLGRSFVNRRPVNSIVGEAIPVTASLVLGGAALVMLVSIPIGVLSATRPRSIMDRFSMAFVLIGISLPVVFTGLLLQYFIGFKWDLLPNAGYCNLINLPAYATCGGLVDWFSHLILPWITFAIPLAAVFVRMIRSNVMDVLGDDYVLTARAKGAPEHQVLRKHVLRNALLPMVTMLGMDIAIALGGAIFVEYIYGLPGLGRTAVTSLQDLDLPTIQGIVVFTTTCIIVINLIVDISYAIIDPRVAPEVASE
jgi:peptide/nickel transport system permease protein